MEIKINNEFKNLIPPLTPHEYNQLEISIINEGCRDALILWNDILVDGHNRYEICTKHNISFNTVQHEFEDINDAKLWIIVNQLARRNLSPYERSVVALTQKKLIEFKAKQNLKLSQGKGIKGSPNSANLIDTREEIAKVAGVGHDTISKVEKIEEKATEEEKENLVKGTTTINKVHKRISDEEKAERRKELAEKCKNLFIDVDFRLGDFNTVLENIPDNSVDVIITDPPYPIKYIDCWEQLSLFASRKLREGGFCIAYSGQYNLYEVMTRMNKHLRYYWTFAMYHEGTTQIVNTVNLMCRWKPVLIYQKGQRKLPNTFQDYFKSDAREKESHEWQQSKSGVSYLIEMFTNEGDLIVDPFAGSGTTIIAAKEKNRRIIAAEISEETYNIAKLNIMNYDKEKK